MTTHTQTLEKGSTRSSMAHIHWLLAIQSLVIVLGSINRLSSLTIGYVASNEFLRWVDFHNMLTLPLISLSAFYLLKKRLEQDGSPLDAGRLALNLAFLIGAYLLGAGYGAHEVTNYLHTRFCLGQEADPLCRIIAFNDDGFSHWVFFIGFTLVNTSLLYIQALFPHPTRVSTGDRFLLVLNGLFIAAGIFANLAFERISLDLYVVAVLAILALGLLWRRGAQPLFIYYSTAYSLGLVATALYKTLIR